MRYIIAILLLVTLSSAGYETRYEKIKAFHSEIDIQKDGSVIVTEEITVLALGNRIKRGIFRDIPLNLKINEKTIRQELSVISVRRGDFDEPFETKMIKGGIRIQIGQKDEYLGRGVHKYLIKYRMDRTIFEGEEVADLMWNVNGNNWDFYIDTLSAIVTLPEKAELLGYDAWTGMKGEKNKNFSVEVLNDTTVLFESKFLASNEGVTVNVRFDKDIMQEVSESAELEYYIRDNFLLIIAIGAILITFLINFVLWIKYGKDPKKGTIIPQFYPPDGWSPAELSYLLNEGEEDDNTFAAQLLQLAVKGHIKIEKKESKSNDDIFVISPLESSQAKQALTDLESGFLNALLGTKPYIIIKGKYSANVNKANNYLISKIEKSQKGKYFRKNRNLLIPQYLIPVLSIVLMLTVMNYYEGPAWVIPVSIVLMIVMNIIFMKLFYQPTMKGRKMLDHIMGLKRFIAHADELRINATNKPDMNFDYFERNLPYAIAFGMADEWGEQFDASTLEPNFKNSNYYMPGYALTNLAFISALSSTTSLASIPPSSAGTSGGGFSGGGFSGGGAGGGGGGGW